MRANAPQALFHTDGVQALGKVELSLASLGVHSLAVSAHKIHGPKGSGALILKPDVRPQPLWMGGGQEQDVRSGTENVAGIAGLGLAAELAETGRAEHCRHMTGLREVLRTQLSRIEGAKMLFEEGASVSPAIAAVLLPGPPAEVWMHHLEERGVMTSVGSACHAKKSAVSPALIALGLSEAQAKQVLRFSFCGHSETAEVEQACAVLVELEASLCRPTR